MKLEKRNSIKVATYNEIVSNSNYVKEDYISIRHFNYPRKLINKLIKLGEIEICYNIIIDCGYYLSTTIDGEEIMIVKELLNKEHYDMHNELINIENYNNYHLHYDSVMCKNPQIQKENKLI